MGGACGFAYVNVYPGNCSFARRMGMRKAYYGGAEMSAGKCGQDRYDQSYERGMAAATAYAAVLTAAGIKAYPTGRID
jgi:hypothetical protein